MWWAKYWKYVVASAVLLVLVLGGVGATLHKRSVSTALIKQQKEMLDAFKAGDAEKDREFRGRMEAKDQRLAVLEEREKGLKTALKVAQERREAPFVPPQSDDEMINRWKALGY